MTDIIIFSGQSNMQGQTESCPDPAPVAGAFEYRLCRDSLIPLAHPVGETVGEGLLWGAHEGKGSLIPDFCRAYITETGRDVVAIHAARGATTVSEWQPPSARFDALTEKCQKGLEATCRMDEIGRVWFVWLQGESDAIYGTSHADYMAMLCAFRASLAERLPIDGFALIRVGKFVGDTRDIEIIRAQEQLGKTEGFVMLTRLTGCCTNDPERWISPFAPGHYNNAAMTLIGEAAGKHLGMYAEGRSFELEPEPYDEVRV